MTELEQMLLKAIDEILEDVPTLTKSQLLMRVLTIANVARKRATSMVDAKDKQVSGKPGLYDTNYKCKCGYEWSESIDATDDENYERARHDCPLVGLSNLGKYRIVK